MLLAELVETSSRVTATSARLEKVALIAELLRRAAPEEIPAVTAFLSGRLLQGKVGLGWAAFDEASRAPAEKNLDLFATDALPPTILEVDRAFAQLAKLTGPRSAQARTRVLGDLMRRVTPAERDFLIRLPWVSCARERWPVSWRRRSRKPRRCLPNRSGAP